MLHLHFGILFLMCVRMFANAAQCVHEGNNYVTIQSTKQLESNGCSVPSFVQLPSDAPDFTSCCHLHDACYSICQESQAVCDNDFHKCMKALCKSENPSASQSCLETANMFHMGVSMFGAQGFQTTQNAHCDCIKRTKAKQHYTKLLNDFYSKYTDKGPVSVSEVAVDGSESLGEVGSSTIVDVLPASVRKNITQFVEPGGYKKFNKLYYKLHKKYPKAFKFIEKTF